jgi:hypothetical protein
MQTRSTILAAAAFALCLGRIESALAQYVPPVNSTASNGALMTLPLTGRPSRRNGMWLTVDNRWVNNYGYHPVQATIGVARPSTTDRTVRLRLRNAPWSPFEGSVWVEQELKLPKGSASVSAIVTVPKFRYNSWGGNTGMSAEVWVDGRIDKDLSSGLASGIFGGTTSQAWDVAILTIDSTKPARQAGGNNNAFNDRLVWMPIADLPKRWIEYTALDVIVVSATELKQISGRNPAALLAIQRWARSGGQLWVESAGQRWENLGEVARLLGMQPNGPVNITEANAAEHGWKPIPYLAADWDGKVVRFSNRRDGTSREVRDPSVIAQYRADPNYYVVEERTETDSARERERARWKDALGQCLQQPLGMGAVRAFRTSEVTEKMDRREPLVDTMTEVSATRVALETTRSWTNRHGLAPDTQNSEFSHWMLPGVGLAPVTEFCILITLFVLVIGPVNYILLKRLQRLHLLVITVPAAALLLTAALFAYALVADGLGTKVRVMSFAHIDQRSGEAVCWSRLSYYAGLAPGRGLEMPSDVALYPIVPDWFGGGGNAELRINRDLVWDEPQMRLTRGWLRSRTPTQYLAVRARKSPARLEIGLGEDRMQVKNELGAPIHFLAVAGPSARFFPGETIAEGAAVELSPTEQREAARRLGELARRNRPAPPAALTPADGRTFSMQDALIMSYSMYDYDYSGAMLSGNLLHNEIEQWTSMSDPVSTPWPPRTYVAITKKGPEVEIGMEGTLEEESFHVVVGQW